MEIYDLIISPNETLKNALERMTRNKKGALIICDEHFHLLGIITDGDIRRALLDNILLIAPVSKVMNTSPIMAKSEEEATEMIKHTGYVLIPIVDLKGYLKGAGVLEFENVKILRLEEEEIEMEKKEAIAIIPARGGSKRIPKKNIAKLGGRPLIYWAINAAKNSNYIDKIIVSTEDNEIAEIAKNYGAEIPFLRPKELALDETPTVDVLVHSFNWIKENYGNKYKYGVLLEPTAPFRLPSHIDSSIETLIASDCDCVVSVSEVPHTLNPEELLVIENGQLKPFKKNLELDKRKPRDKQEKVYVQNGLVYAFKINSLLENKSLYGKKVLPYIIEWHFFIDIDTIEDLKIANLIFEDFYERYLYEYEKIE